MENSCRKKHKPSPKKWILASRRTGFRRNSALIPANAGLYHYAGNCPVRYIDPDGRRTMTAYEKKFAREILGNAAPLNTNVYKNFSDDGSFSPPLGFVLIQKTLYSDSMTRGEQLSVLMHELFHQVQYIKNPIEVKIYAGLPFEFSAGVSVSLSGHSIGISANARARVSAFVGISASIGVFPSLAREFFIDEFMGIVSDKKGKGFVYNYGELSQYNSLSDFPYLESQAEMVGDFAYFYYQERYGIGIENEQKVNMKRMAEILKNSGYKSEAIKWVLERY